MNQKIILPIISLAGLALFSGCATDAHYVSTGDKEQIISVGQINIQDYANAANAAVKDLLESGVLDRSPNQPALVEISQIINNTSQQVDTDLITKKISIAMLQSGKALTKTVDTKAIGLQQENEFMADQKTTRLPDFTLSGKIIETVDRAGSTRRTTYSFQFALNDAKAGVEAWAVEKEIGKQGTRSSVGF